MGSILIRLGISVAGKLIIEGIKWLAGKDDNDLTLASAAKMKVMCESVLIEAKKK